MRNAYVDGLLADTDLTWRQPEQVRVEEALEAARGLPDAFRPAPLEVPDNGRT